MFTYIEPKIVSKDHCVRTDGCRGSRALDAVPVAEGVKTGHCPCGTRSLSLRPEAYQFRFLLHAGC